MWLKVEFLEKVWNAAHAFLKNYFFYILDRFDALISKIIFKILKKIILIHFDMKNILKNNHNNAPRKAQSINLDCIL